MSFWVVLGLTAAILMVLAAWLMAEQEVRRLTRENDHLLHRCRDLETILTDAVATAAGSRQKPYWAAILEEETKTYFKSHFTPGEIESFERIKRRLFFRRVLYFWRSSD